LNTIKLAKIYRVIAESATAQNGIVFSVSGEEICLF
jgi:hypothetical protein